ncbi:MAG: sigma-70 family RNA polymerase sigma factor [Tepidisphaeraceae bacterium]
MTDGDLLGKFVNRGDQEAFRAIVQRHGDMVYSAAVRQLGDLSLAEDVTQAVFIVLAKKAAKVNGPMLAGWLVKAARYLALEARRGEWRRKAREREAAAMKGETEQADQWLQMGPVLDEALSSLGERDRTAVTLRYLEGRDPRQVASAMGVSEEAAAKRLTRALAKLRKRFGRHGVDVPAASIGITLLAQTRLAAPAGLAEKCFTAAVGSTAAAGTAAAATTASGTLAHAAITSSAFGGFAAWGYATVAAVVILTTVGTGVVRHLSKPRQVAVPTVTVAPPLVTTPMRVGIFVSRFTAEGPHMTRTAYGYGHLDVDRVLRTDPLLQLIPVVEPGTENDPKIIDMVRTTFLHVSPINGADSSQLMTLDVIVLPRVWNETPEVMNAIEFAARQGKGVLIVAGFAVTSPGPSPQVDRLNGLKEAKYGASDDAVDCQVIADHPLLGTLSKGDSLNIEANGEFGVLPDDAVPLIRVKDPAAASAIWFATPTTLLSTNSPEGTFYPLFIGHLGKVTIVSCNFPAWSPVPAALDAATNGQFLARCVRWLGNRPLP